MYTPVNDKDLSEAEGLLTAFELSVPYVRKSTQQEAPYYDTMGALASISGMCLNCDTLSVAFWRWECYKATPGVGGEAVRKCFG